MPVGILWRKRLALAAAAVVSRLEGRREGEAQLVMLSRCTNPAMIPAPPVGC
jgi:hypothetical protein